MPAEREHGGEDSGERGRGESSRSRRTRCVGVGATICASRASRMRRPYSGAAEPRSACSCISSADVHVRGRGVRAHQYIAKEHEHDQLMGIVASAAKRTAAVTNKSGFVSGFARARTTGTRIDSTSKLGVQGSLMPRQYSATGRAHAAPHEQACPVKRRQRTVVAQSAALRLCRSSRSISTSISRK